MTIIVDEALLSECEEKARKATRGPWVIIPAVEYDGDDDDIQGAYTSPGGIEGGDGNPVCVFGTLEGSGALFDSAPNDQHIARMDPPHHSRPHRADT